MFNFIKKTMLVGVGLAAVTREKIEEIIGELVKKGELSEKEGKVMVDELVEKSKKVKKDLEKKVEKIVADTLNKLNIPTREELTELKKKIQKLEKKG
ncbi:MAG: phasin family protein [Syntrophales bacterium]|nr:phasin family protein [Syntrophales bacterium]